MVSFTVDNQNGYDMQIQVESKDVASHIKNEHRYIPLKHGAEYKVRLVNSTSKRCNVSLSIDEKIMGKWRINPNSSITIERSSNSSRKFTFVKEDTWEAGMGGIKQGSFSNGLIEAKFIPESEHQNIQSNSIKGHKNSLSLGSYSDDSNGSNSFSAGATLLGNRSSQEFGTAAEMFEDISRSVTKKLRLVVENTRPQYVPLEHCDSTPPRIETSGCRPVEFFETSGCRPSEFFETSRCRFDESMN
jgi:hypothetical protein